MISYSKRLYYCIYENNKVSNNNYYYNASAKNNIDGIDWMDRSHILSLRLGSIIYMNMYGQYFKGFSKRSHTSIVNFNNTILRPNDNSTNNNNIIWWDDYRARTAFCRLPRLLYALENDFSVKPFYKKYYIVTSKPEGRRRLQRTDVLKTIICFVHKPNGFSARRLRVHCSHRRRRRRHCSPRVTTTKRSSRQILPRIATIPIYYNL